MTYKSPIKMDHTKSQYRTVTAQRYDVIGKCLRWLDVYVRGVRISLFQISIQEFDIGLYRSERLPHFGLRGL